MAERLLARPTGHLKLAPWARFFHTDPGFLPTTLRALVARTLAQ